MAAQNHLSRGVRSSQKMLQTLWHGEVSGLTSGEKMSNPSKCRARSHFFHPFNHLQFQHPLIVSLSLSQNLPVGPSLLFCFGSVFANKSAPGEFPGHQAPSFSLFYNQNPLEQPCWCPFAQFRAQWPLGHSCYGERAKLCKYPQTCARTSCWRP